MEIKTEKISPAQLTDKPEGSFLKKNILKEEIEGVAIELTSVKGPAQINEEASADYYDVLLYLKGESLLSTGKKEYMVKADFIVRPAFDKPYTLLTGEKEEFHFIKIRKYLDDKDRHVILEHPEKHSSVYIKPLAECPVYTEDIKSEKTVNRMILPEGLVPRFCMGSVETTGPDEVGEHEHPMLDQLFFGLQRCKVTCFADGATAVLTENMMLHIPPGSKHSVTVAEGDKLAYIWFDFFLNLKGEKYMKKQHYLNDD